MCMLNGELGGTITALTQDFGIADYVDAQGKTIKKENILIKDIITSGVHTFANEPFSNIVVNDLDDALALMEYRGEEPMYAILNEDTQLIEQISFDPLDLPKWENAKETIRFDNNSFNFNSFKDFYQGFSENYTLVSYNGKKCSVIKIDHGETAGYTITGLTYPGELVGKIGESFTTILDKIVKAFGDFEYFYDTDGTFIFQKKKIYVNQTWSPLVESEDGVYVQTMEDTPYGYEFQGNKLITSFSNTPNFSKVKNDFAIWGVNNSGGPIHLRYAIHKKPERYMTFPRPVGDLVDKQVLFISDNINGYHTTIDENGQIIKYCDWREIIFQMAYDYNFHHLEDDFLVNIEKNNIYKDKEETINLYPKGKTGYEQYYIDLIGF